MAICEIPLTPNNEFLLEGESYRIDHVLKDDFFALTIKIENNSKEKFVLKISRVKVRFLRPVLQFALTWLGKHEAFLYRSLQDTEGVPKLHQAHDNWLIHHYIEGQNLKQFRQVSDTFFDELSLLVQELHQKGIVYIDLAKKDNIIVGEDKKPYLIDFQISWLFKKSPNFLSRYLFNIFARADLYHLYKHKKSIRRDLLKESEYQQWKQRGSLHTLHEYIIARPFRWIKRKILPSYF